jgi:hypothetical protein
MKGDSHISFHYTQSIGSVSTKGDDESISTKGDGDRGKSTEEAAAEVPPAKPEVPDEMIAADTEDV